MAKNKSSKEKEPVIKGWKWIFYIIGWLTGVLSPLFWMIMIALHLTKNYGEPFFNKDFHKRVFYWGIVMTVIYSIITIAALYSMGVFSPVNEYDNSSTSYETIKDKISVPSVEESNNTTRYINYYVVLNETTTLKPNYFYYVCLNLTKYYPYFEFSVNSMSSKSFEVYFIPGEDLNCFETRSCSYSYYEELYQDTKHYHKTVDLSYEEISNWCFITYNNDNLNQSNKIHLKIINYDYPPGNMSFEVPTNLTLTLSYPYE